MLYMHVAELDDVTAFIDELAYGKSAKSIHIECL